MATRKIVKSEDPILRKISKPVTEFNEKLWFLLDDMKETMMQANGVGLAGPQVGVLKQVVTMCVNDMYIEMVNPVIVKEVGKELYAEGCLSCPGVSGYVFRAKTVKVRAQDRYGVPFELTGNEMLAQCISHETDHLKGILFIDKMEKNVKNSKK